MPRLIACLLMGLMLTSAPARADGIETTARFDVFLLGVKVAEMHLSGSETGKGYVATARLWTTGLAGALSPGARICR